MAFKPMRVKGRISKPRVKFTLENLELDPAYQNIELDLDKRLLDQVRRQESNIWSQ